MKDRRGFLKAAGAGVLSAAAYRNVLGANERVRVGFIGIGLIGKRHLLDFLAQPDVEAAAICEVYKPRLREGVATVEEKSGRKAEGFKDFRRMYDRKDIDAVVVSTPDHWHAPQIVLACASGQGRLRRKTDDALRPRRPVDGRGRETLQSRRAGRHAAAFGRAIQTMRRDDPRAAASAKGSATSASPFRNSTPGFHGGHRGGADLSEQDFRMWLGFQDERDLRQESRIYHFRWFWDYSGRPPFESAFCTISTSRHGRCDLQCR